MNLDRRTLKKIALLIVFTVITVFAVLRIGDIANIVRNFFNALSPLLIGGCIAFVMNLLMRPLERFWFKIWKKRPEFAQKSVRAVCLTASSLIVLGALTAVLFVIIPEIAETVVNIIDMLPQYFDRLKSGWEHLSKQLAKYSIILPEFDIGNSGIFDKLMDIVSQGGQVVFDKTIGLTKGLFSTVFNIVVGFIFSLYILSGKEKYGRKLKKLASAFLPQSHTDRLFEEIARVNRTFSNFVAGQLIEALIIGSLCFIGMLIFRFPYAPVVSVLVGVTALVPVFGAFIGTAIGAFLILVDSPIKAFWFVVFIIILQQLEGNIIYPHVAGRAVGLPGILVLGAVTLGGNLFGVLGMLLSVPVCSLVYFTIVELAGKKLEEKGLDDDELPGDGNAEERKKEKANRPRIRDLWKSFWKTDNKNDTKTETSDISDPNINDKNEKGEINETDSGDNDREI